MKQRIVILLPVLLAAAVLLFSGEPVAGAPTTFGGVFVAGNGSALPTDPDANAAIAGEEATFNNSIDKVTEKLDAADWDATKQEKVKQGTEAAVQTAINKFKKGGTKELQPGDEFVFYFAGHGGDSLFPDATETGEGNGSDNHIRISGTDRITDDELATYLSGFKQSVTVNVILDSCKSNTFTDGANDLPSITQKDNSDADVPGGGHIAVIAAGPSPSFGLNDPNGMKFTQKVVDGLTPGNDGFLKADSNKDGTVTTQELANFTGGLFTGPRPACDGTEDCPCSSESSHTDTGDPLNEVAEPGLPAVGGIAELPPHRGDASARSSDGSGLSPGGIAAIAAGAAGAVLSLVAGGWYARRRWLR